MKRIVRQALHAAGNPARAPGPGGCLTPTARRFFLAPPISQKESPAVGDRRPTVPFVSLLPVFLAFIAARGFALYRAFRGGAG